MIFIWYLKCIVKVYVKHYCLEVNKIFLFVFKVLYMIFDQNYNNIV